MHAAEYAGKLGKLPEVNSAEIEASTNEWLTPFEETGSENPYSVHAELQQCMQDLVGIIRTESELKAALDTIDKLKGKLKQVQVPGNRQFNPAWHLALDLRSMLAISEAVTRSALERRESRGAQTRDDYPKTDPEYGKINFISRQKNGELTVVREPLPAMPDELRRLIEEQ